MGLMDILNQKGKKVAVGMALGGALLGAGCSREGSEEAKDNKAQMEQRVENKSEIRQKIAYLDEYAAAVEAGKDKVQAYYEFASKLADGNSDKAAEMKRQVKELQKELRISENLRNLGNVGGFFLLLVLLFEEKNNRNVSNLSKSQGTKDRD